MVKVFVRFGGNQTSVDIPNAFEHTPNEQLASECVTRLKQAWAGIVDAKDSWVVEMINGIRHFTFTPVGGTKA